MDQITSTPQPMVMSVKDWFITLLITCIPIIGFIMLFVWGFGSSEKPERSNWAKGALLLIAAFMALNVLMMIIFGSAFFAGLGLWGNNGGY